MTVRIAIIGAGMAGASCAWHLQQAGLAVDVFDKSAEVGGRMVTRRAAARGEDSPTVRSFDYGAQYFTARDEGLRAFVESQLGERGVIAGWQPRLQAAAEHPIRRSRDEEDWLVGVPSMPAALRPLLNGSTLVTQAHILHLEQDADGWTLEAAEGPNEHTRYGAYASVVVAVPAPLARRLVAPHVPELGKLCLAVPMLPCWSAMLVSEALPDVPDVFVDVAPGLAWMARDSSKPGRRLEPGLDTWVVHAGADWSREQLEREASAVAQSLAEQVVEALQVQGHEMRVISAGAHRWRYASMAAAAPKAKGPAAASEDGLILCGDYFGAGDIESAFVSGRDAARQLLDAL